MFTDIEGSTRRWQLDATAMNDALSRHDEIVRTAIGEADGYVFATGGDGFGVAFGDPDAALTAAKSIQDAIAIEEWPTADPMAVRIGLHVGTANERNGDYFGPAVNLAARIEAAAHGGQTLISDDLARFTTTPALDLGAHRLKDIDGPVRLWQIGDADHPPLRTIDRSLNTLPSARAELIGREADIGAARRALLTNRLVTVSGPGGCGKTRIALEIAHEELGHRPGGVFFVDLTTAEDQDGGLWEAALLGIGLSPQGAADARVLDFLRDRHALVVLDNCEHVIDQAAELAERLLDRCPHVHIVATSREALDVEGERVIRLPSLGAEAAAALFIRRATNAGATLQATDDDEIAAICQQLDGIPLAIELAAARTLSMSVAEIRDNLDDRFTLLSGGRRRARRRQQTLSGTLDWSHDLLDPDEQTMLRRLAVFVGGFRLDDVPAVTGFDAGTARDLVESLTRKSLIDTVRHTDESVGRRLLETVRLYGLDRLLEAGEAAETRLAHYEHFANLLLTREVTDLRGDAAHQQLEANYGANLDQAIEYAVSTGRVLEAGGLVSRSTLHLMRTGGLGSHGELVLAASHSGDVAQRAAVCAAAPAILAIGDFEVAFELTGRAEALLDAGHLTGDLVMALWPKMMAMTMAGEFDAALAFSDRLMSAVREQGIGGTGVLAASTGRAGILGARNDFAAAAAAAVEGRSPNNVSADQTIADCHAAWWSLLSDAPRPMRSPSAIHPSSTFAYLHTIADIIWAMPGEPEEVGAQLARVAARDVTGRIPGQEGDYLWLFAYLHYIDGRRGRAQHVLDNGAARVLGMPALWVVAQVERWAVHEISDRAGALSAAFLEPQERQRRRDAGSVTLSEEIAFWLGSETALG